MPKRTIKSTRSNKRIKVDPNEKEVNNNHDKQFDYELLNHSKSNCKLSINEVNKSTDNDIKSEKKVTELSKNDFETKSNVKIKNESGSNSIKEETATTSKQSTSGQFNKSKNVSIKKGLASDDPSSTIKTTKNKLPLVHNGITYYCSYLPVNIQQQWDGICEMRKKGGIAGEANVDSLGCNHLHDKEEKNPKIKRFQTLVSIILSSQTQDPQVAIGMGNLKAYGLTVENISKIDFETFDNMIKNISFHQTKTKNIIQTAKILKEKYDSDVPNTKREMLSLPGCGLKVSNLAMASCWNELVGIAVDTHMNRIFQRLGWSNEKNPDKQSKEIESWLPRAMWDDINHKLVGFGQKICSSKKPKCNECLISQYCPYYLDMF